MVDIPEWFRKEGKAVKKAPWLFAISVLIAATVLGGGIYGLMELLYSAQLHSKEAMIEQIGSDRDSYKQHWDDDEKAIAKLRSLSPSGIFTQIVTTVSSVTNVEIVTQMVTKVSYPQEIQETFTLSRKWRIGVFIRTNGGPLVFFRLKYVPINGVVEGNFTDPVSLTPEAPLIDLHSMGNIVWATFATTNDLDKMTFFLKYDRDETMPNDVTNIYEINGTLFMDGKKVGLNLTNAPDG